jgi:HNH endonuclease
MFKKIFVKKSRENLKDEIWKKHPDYNLKVSNKGRIQSLNKKNQGPTFGKPNRQGYRTYDYYENCKCIFQRAVHSLIMEVFDFEGYIYTCYLDKNFKAVVDHINEIRDDNRLENLEWVTPSENTLRSFRNKKLKLTH